MLNILNNPGQEVLIGLMCLASFRIYLEIIDFDFKKLPLSKMMAKGRGEEQLDKFHRYGLIFSVGFIILFAPQLLLS